MASNPTIFDSRPSHTPEWGISEFSALLKKRVEEDFGQVRLRGEISQPKLHSSGHLYLTLKDEHAVIAAVCWRGQVSKLKIKPEEGMEVVAAGRITTYPGRSQYQLVIEQMTLAGIGALLKMLEERKKNLAAEGLFDAARKKPLPFLPRCIGVITSPTGAVIRDILHRLAERFPVRVLVWPVAVQGEGAAQQVAGAITGFNAMDESQRPDLLIVARGGGSLEDMLPFYEEAVVRAAAYSSIPLISAIGHETDTCFMDYAADRRAPTPTAAAEMAVPVRLDLLEYVQGQASRLNRAVMRFMATQHTGLQHAVARLLHPRQLIEYLSQRLDERSTRLMLAIKNNLAHRAQRLLKIAAGLSLTPLKMRQHHHTQKLAGVAEQLQKNLQRLLDKKHERLNSQAALLESYSYTKILQRGFALVRDAHGQPVLRAAAIHKDDVLELVFADASTQVRAEQ